jgi:hypothetical protein
MRQADIERCIVQGGVQQREGEKKIIMDRDSIRYYLTIGNAYLGQKASERFVPIKDGIKETINGQTAYKFDRFLCFDYEILQTRYGLHLERFSAAEAEELEKKENPEPPKHKAAEQELF